MHNFGSHETAIRSVLYTRSTSGRLRSSLSLIGPLSISISAPIGVIQLNRYLNRVQVKLFHFLHLYGDQRLEASHEYSINSGFIICFKKSRTKNASFRVRSTLNEATRDFDWKRSCFDKRSNSQQHLLIDANVINVVILGKNS